MISKLFTFIFWVTIAIACNGKNSAPAKSASMSQVIFSPAGVDISVLVEVAISQKDHQRGLMYRQSLETNHGMLFIFKDEAIRSFWMKNTYIPLDMIFINSQLQVVGVIHNAKPLSLSSRSVDTPAKYVVEVNAGYAKHFGITRGTSVRFDLNSTTSTSH
ncbi:MAG: DUF192 domain-containing protein [Deltaproteobacteria bacterium]|nr:DUF192 domain-containing protein [Deltaproteobacteria bacterium]